MRSVKRERASVLKGAALRNSFNPPTSPFFWEITILFDRFLDGEVNQAFWPAVRTPLPYAEAAVDRCGLVQMACGVVRLVLVAGMMAAGWCGAMRLGECFCGWHHFLQQA